MNWSYALTPFLAWIAAGAAKGVGLAVKYVLDKRYVFTQETA